MRGLPLLALLVLTGCNPGITPPQATRNEAATASNQVQRTPEPPVNSAVPPPADVTEPRASSEPATGAAGMSPYRRREYERGYRDCMTGNFDGERQGESYRIGCMAAEDVKQPSARR